MARGLERPGGDRPWARPASEIADALGAGPGGLTAAEVRRRQRVFGPNRLTERRPRSGWAILWDQFASPIVGLLAAAAVVAFVFEETVEAVAILVVVFVNAAIGFVTERRALRSMEALRALGQTTTRVRRDGAVHLVSALELVPGDRVVLEAGDMLTADLRLLDASRLQVDESPLTGESVPVDKTIEPVAPEAALADRTSMGFKGTALTRGSGEAVVVATGMDTELGRISALVESAEAERTPLERRLDRLARWLVVLTLGIASMVAVAVVSSGRSLYVAVEIGIALAVAAIPEGLPIVATIALARGMWRMARRNALIEQLAAVETLGSTTVLLTDKTGTLTENRMTAVVYALGEDGEEAEIGGAGLEPEGGFSVDGAPLDPSSRADLWTALRVGVLCNNASIEGAGDERRAIGDPTEVALVVAGEKAGLRKKALTIELPERREIAFDVETKWMATVHDGPDGLWAAVKGAPETILPACAAVLGARGARPLDAEARARWLSRAETLAARGHRVLALATGAARTPEAFAFRDLTLAGLVALLDPPRPEVRAAVDALSAAGIRVVMITGDHAATARAVGCAVGLAEEDTEVVDGRQVAAADEAAWARAPIVARATPGRKLDIVAARQRAGEVVAMIGDGVNDAPALRKADIGVAMGRRGTQVAKEAADMVLQDDRLGTLVVAVAEGRAIYENIRKFVVYLMSCNVSEILVVGVGALLPGPLPLLPLQILFLNLVTDVFPALALGVGEGSPALMREGPRPPEESLLTRRHWLEIFGLGGVMAASVLLAFTGAGLLLETPPAETNTIAFSSLALAQLWHVFSMRNLDSGWVVNEVTRNRWVWAALALCLALVGLAVGFSPLARVLGVVWPSASGWGLAVSTSLVPLLVGQLVLWARGLRARRAGRATVPSGAP